MKDFESTLNIRRTQDHSFPKASYSEWVEAAKKTLKGKSVSDYQTKTYEQIDIQPLYTKNDLPDEVKEIQNSMKKNPSWSIVHKVTGKSVEEINERMVKVLQMGTNVISLPILPSLTKEKMEDFLKNIPINRIPFFIDGKIYTVGFYVLLADWLKKKKLDHRTVSGFIGTDPFQLLMENPKHKEWDNLFANWSDGVLYGKDQFPNLKTIFVNSSIFEQDGAHSVQQLAYSLLEIVEYVEHFRKKGLEEKEIFQKIVVGFSISSDFFMEIAKLRAFRYLWKKLLEAYGVDKPIDATIFARTSFVNKTKTDPYMNLIRSGSEAFSSVVGQVDYLYISPFDEVLGQSSEKGIRLSINTHHILKEEANLAKVCDPGAGSYFIEHLTKSLIERSWAYFVELDKLGGFLFALSKGVIQKELNKMREVRQRDYNKEKKVLVGTNRYANPKDQISFNMETGETWQQTDIMMPLVDMQIKLAEGYSLKDCVKSVSLKEERQQVQRFRLSEPFEQCRMKIERQVKGNNRNVALIIQGDYITHKRIIDFTSNVFASVGLELSICTEGENPEKVKRFLKETNPVLLGYLYAEKDTHPYVDERPVFYVHEQSIGVEDNGSIRQGENLFLYPGIDQISFFNEMIDILGGKK
ncbi:methylmalonyl-CoA mutase family protein [Fervidibacillus halotolerans]|uniref:Methylmalonyl-CoA mutase family protein n=1 Tax=Fervidibacillus halotolerans TaxID=2980027 RepID=A0A9E8RXQ2_9BACI|nr:methylmalonyl-CoA mutase family protein [Fervidibacillus halotolerans]WAA11403.1 methylmalonyl-CoA mutase family protein [Fervidibacillus halotolerans]